MKPRYQPIKTRGHARVLVRDESGAADVSVEERRKPERAGGLKNVELEKTSRGQFLVFTTSDGDRFALNLDCQEEFGFEAKTTLQKWASEQDWG